VVQSALRAFLDGYITARAYLQMVIEALFADVP
jgi:hypothetical protein